VLDLSEYRDYAFENSTPEEEYADMQGDFSPPPEPDEYYASMLAQDEKQQALYRIFRTLVNLVHVDICWLK
jgi:hypothetical protein